MSFCPVPVEQQPVNEYQELTQSWFFQWVTLPKFQFLSKLSGIWFLSLLLTAPISSASFPPQEQIIPFLLASALGSALFVAFALVRLYLGWKYIGDRLKKTKIVYEESSWYDGQVWEKPLEIYNRDKLIFNYQVEPILNRLKKSSLLLTSIMISGLLSFCLI
jgi:hypothetical protein